MCQGWRTQRRTPTAPKAHSQRANTSASRMPNCAVEMVAPVVGETNLFMHSCCMIRPAALMPMPVQRIASSLGRREIRKTSQSSALPCSRSAGRISSTPTNNDTTDKTASASARRMVDRCLRMKIPLFLLQVSRYKHPDIKRTPCAETGLTCSHTARSKKFCYFYVQTLFFYKSAFARRFYHKPQTVSSG